MSPPTLREAPLSLCHLIQHVLRKYKLDINTTRLVIEDPEVLGYAKTFFDCAQSLFNPDTDGCMRVTVRAGADGQHDINTECRLDEHMDSMYGDMIATSVKVDDAASVMPLETDRGAREVLLRLRKEQRRHIRFETLSSAASSAFSMLQAFHPICAHEFAVRSGCLTAVRHFADARGSIETARDGAYRALPTIPAHPGVASEAATPRMRRASLRAGNGLTQNRTLLSCGRHTTLYQWRFCSLCDVRHFTKELPAQPSGAARTVVVTDDALIFECIKMGVHVYPTMSAHLLHTMPNITDTYETLILLCSGNAETARCEALSKMLFSPRRIYNIVDDAFGLND
jgi:hypothetical protein